jgi:hypothetical protein
MRIPAKPGSTTFFAGRPKRLSNRESSLSREHKHLFTLHPSLGDAELHLDPRPRRLVIPTWRRHSPSGRGRVHTLKPPFGERPPRPATWASDRVQPVPARRRRNRDISYPGQNFPRVRDVLQVWKLHDKSTD